MTAIRGEERFYFDESLLGVGKALAIARTDVVHAGHALVPQAPLGALDTEWIPAVAGLGLVVVARDRRIRTKPAELALLRAHALRVFWLAGKQDESNWGYLVRLVDAWSRIEAFVDNRGAGPWFVAIGKDAHLREFAV